MEEINLKLQMSCNLYYPQRQSHPLTIHHLCALDPNSPCYSDKQAQHAQADTKEEPGPGSYYGRRQHWIVTIVKTVDKEKPVSV